MFPRVTPEIGVTSMPVIDRTAGPHGVLYVVGMSIDKSSNYHQRLHALDITTGAELFDGPGRNRGCSAEQRRDNDFCSGTVFGSGPPCCFAIAGADLYHLDLALRLRPYSGWIIAYEQTTLAQTVVLNVGPNSGASVPNGTHFNMNGPAIWMSGDGPWVADAQGNIYLLTGNGPFEPPHWTRTAFSNMGDFGQLLLEASASTTSSLKRRRLLRDVERGSPNPQVTLIWAPVAKCCCPT